MYDGEWVDDMKHGKGKYILENGEVYDGEWKDDKKHGIGSTTYITFFGNRATKERRWF